jgi:hypothetical protein
MCHTITNSGTTHFQLLPDNYLIGSKDFTLHEDVLYPRIKSNIYYDAKTCSDGVIFLNGRSYQGVVFKIPVKSEEKTFSHRCFRNDLQGGFHIHPLSRTPDIIFKDRSFKTTLTTIVAFKSKQLLFYDDYDVSVEQFLILKPKIVNHLLLSEYSRQMYQKVYQYALNTAEYYRIMGGNL